jgi:hypothetical protein
VGDDASTPDTAAIGADRLTAEAAREAG